MIKLSFAFIVLVLPLGVLAGCIAPRTPRSIDGAVAVFTQVEYLNGDAKGKTKNILGGATILSPRHILITIHQMNSGNQELFIRGHGWNNSVCVKRYIDPMNSVVGWEVRELEYHLNQVIPVKFSVEPEKYANRFCYILKDSDLDSFRQVGRDLFFQKMSTPLSLVAFQGVLLHSDNVAHPLGESYMSDKLFVRIDKGQGLRDYNDLAGSSGFPVVVYDKDIDQWITVGITDSGNVDPETGYIIVTVVYPPYELIEQIQSQWPMVEPTQPKAEQP